MPLDLGDVWAGQVEIRDANGALAAADAVALTVTLPDGTTTSPSVGTPSTGIYTATLPTTLAGRYGARWVATGANASAFVDAFDVLDPAVFPLVSLDEIRAHMGWSSPATQADRDRDEMCRALADTATALLEDYCGVAFRRRTVVETQDGGRSVLLLRHGPVLSVTSVTQDGTAVDAGTYRLDSTAGILRRAGGIWGTSYPQSVTTTYVVGYASPPEPIRWAVRSQVEEWWMRSQQSSHAAFGSGQNFDDLQPNVLGGLSYRVRAAADPYRMPATP